jgi:hypothetical protein
MGCFDCTTWTDGESETQSHDGVLCSILILYVPEKSGGIPRRLFGCSDAIDFLTIDQGISTEDHPVQSELARIHSYIGKLKEVTGHSWCLDKSSEKNIYFIEFEPLRDIFVYLAANAEKDKARLRLNKDAAERFIKGSLVMTSSSTFNMLTVE